MRPDEIIPVYLICGFLESGKTSLIRSMLEDENFSRGVKTLVLCCEEGIEELEDDFLSAHNASVHIFDSADEMTAAKLKQLNSQYKPERIIMEYNTMWTLEKLGSTRLPPRWDFVQVITLADGSTFDNYLTNMRTLLIDPMKEADLVMVNRCKPEHPISQWRRVIRAANPNCNILFEMVDGTTQDGITDEDLPYDMKAEVIDITDENLDIFYLDALDHPDRYDGKAIRILGIPFADSSFPKGFYFFGRYAMTCCANDIQKIGWVTKGSLTPSGKSFYYLTARCQKVESPEGEVLLLGEMKTEKAQEPKEKVITFGGSGANP